MNCEYSKGELGKYEKAYNEGSHSYSEFIEYVRQICNEYKTLPYILFFVNSSVYRPFKSLEEAVCYPVYDSVCNINIYFVSGLTKKQFYECRKNSICLITNPDYITNSDQLDNLVKLVSEMKFLGEITFVTKTDNIKISNKF